MIELLDAVTGDPVQLRRAYGCFPSGVTAVCALVDDTPVGMVASSFTSVSMDPALVSVCVQNTSTTWPLLRGLPRIGISVLGAHQERIGRRLGSRTGDRFHGVPWRSTADGCVFIEGAAAWFDCSIEQQIPSGDHDIVVFRVHDLDARADVAPLVFQASRFRRLA
mgnify:CR=1 FL=1